MQEPTLLKNDANLNGIEHTFLIDSCYDIDMKNERGRRLVYSAEEEVLGQLADGYNVSQDAYDQVAYDLPPEELARALLSRWRWTEDSRTLLEAARLFLRAEDYYQAFELCTRQPRSSAMRNMAGEILGRIRRDYPEDKMIGKLLDEAFLVIDLRTGRVERFPGLLPAREWTKEADWTDG
jgi:hypothetical protein